MTMINLDRLTSMVVLATALMVGIVQPIVIGEFNALNALFVVIAIGNAIYLVKEFYKEAEK